MSQLVLSLGGVCVRVHCRDRGVAIAPRIKLKPAESWLSQKLQEATFQLLSETVRNEVPTGSRYSFEKRSVR